MHVQSRRARGIFLALCLGANSPAFASFLFTPGNLVVSLVGNVNGSGPYTDNQATPVKLQEMTASGTLTQSLLLPQTASGSQSAFSGEYGSSSEGLLHLSGDGKSLVIAGYGVNAASYNAGGAAVYGDARLAQSTSIQGGQFTAVSRVIADITANGTIDTSTALYNVFNQNNPRSVATVNGTSFYIAGQGASNSDTTTQGVFLAQLGDSSATQITGVSNYRSVSIQNGQLYASRDYNGPNGAQAAEVDHFATAQPTGASTPAGLPGMGPTINVAIGSTNNGVDDSRKGMTVYLSPEDYFFASDGLNQYMYVADSGNPKNGNVGKAQLGDGGLQKWELIGNTWVLLYDIYSGLGIVSNATATSGTSGLIGLTGQVINGEVYLYATNATLGDLDATSVFSVMDPLTQSNRGAQQGSDIFSSIYTAPLGENVRGIAFAPQVVPEPETLGLVAIGALALLSEKRRKPPRQPRFCPETSANR
jgi:hypothetical protein